MDETTCIVNAVLHLARFFAHESCGKCVPCRVGTQTMVKILERIEAGEGRDGDLDLLLDVCNTMFGKTFCPLGDAATNPITSSIKHFRDEYEYHIREKRCMVGAQHAAPL